MPIDFRVTPDCCADVMEYSTVFLRYEFDAFRDGSYDDKAPHWVIAGVCEGRPAVVEVHRCPHCHEHLPPVRVRETTRKVCRPKADLKGCWTCGKTLTDCQCLPPEYLFEPAVDEVPLWRD